MGLSVSNKQFKTYQNILKREEVKPPLLFPGAIHAEPYQSPRT